MFCRSCGAKLESQARFCTTCGSITGVAAGVAPQTPRRRSQFWIYTLSAFGLLLLMGMCSAILKDSSTNTANTRPASYTSPSSATRHKIGEDVYVGYWGYRCDDVRWQASIGDYSKEYADARFLIVDLSIRNNDKTASVLPPLKLVDAEGREYDESSKGIFLEHSFGALKSLNPGVTSSGSIVFDVPRGSYALKVSGGYTSGEFALIDLQDSSSSTASGSSQSQQCQPHTSIRSDTEQPNDAIKQAAQKCWQAATQGCADSVSPACAISFTLNKRNEYRTTDWQRQALHGTQIWKIALQDQTSKSKVYEEVKCEVPDKGDAKVLGISPKLPDCKPRI